MRTFSCAAALGLRPLDRVQILDRGTLRELASFRRMNPGADIAPPFWFFQRITGTGQLLLRSPSGNPVEVGPFDVCDIRPRADGPIVVRAMPAATWLARSRLPLRDRQNPPAPSDYADAHLQYVRKDRYGFIEVSVLFLDPALNTPGDGGTRLAPLQDEDRRRLAAMATRSSMPVMAMSRPHWSADTGERRRDDKVRHHLASFLAAALRGDSAR